jgi:hypothetical protein
MEELPFPLFSAKTRPLPLFTLAGVHPETTHRHSERSEESRGTHQGEILSFASLEYRLASALQTCP